MNEIEVTVNDLRVVLELITLMASRGAIRPNELVTIGAIYNKYLGIIEKAQQKEYEASSIKNT